MAPRACLSCGQLIRGGSRCPDCDVARRARRTAQWQRVRREVLAAQPQCVVCGSKRSLQVDHRVALVAGGRSELSNAAVVCPGCNSRKRTSEGGASGRVGWGGGGRRVPSADRRWVVTDGGTRVLASDDPQSGSTS